MNTKNLLLGILIVAVFAIGFAIGRFSPTPDTPATVKQPQSTTPTNNVVSTTTEQAKAPSILDSMTADQKKMLSVLGIDINKITPAMISCAETSLGAVRIKEIEGGASLSFTEKAKLLGCYK